MLVPELADPLNCNLLLPDKSFYFFHLMYAEGQLFVHRYVALGTCQDPQAKRKATLVIVRPITHTLLYQWGRVLAALWNI